MMIEIRRSEERGHLDHGWLDTYHTFSFDQYYDPRFLGFRVLRVINEDRVASGAGFPMHGHRDMEILTWILEGALRHQDSMGNGSVIRPGEIQRMSAGTGVRHSEANASDTEPVHLLQIWILPERTGIEPGYEQTAFPPEERRGRLRILASPDGADGSVRIHQDARLYDGLFEEGQEIRHPIGERRHAWLQLARGSLELASGEKLVAGDGAAISGERELAGRATGSAEVLLFDLP